MTRPASTPLRARMRHTRAVALGAERLLDRASARWRSAPGPVRDCVVPAVLLAGSFLPGTAHNGVDLGGLPHHSWDAVALALIAGQSVPLAIARRHPAVSLVVVACSFAAFQCLGYRPAFAGLGILVALCYAGYGGRRPSLLAAVATPAYLALALALAALGSPERAIDFATFFLVLALPWWAGAALRARARSQAERAHLDVELSVAAERRRIAAELHDVVTHHVTAMVLQADAGQVLGQDAAAAGSSSDRVAAAFDTIGEAGRRALVDLRTLLAVLADDGTDPATMTPHLRAVDDLITRSRDAGLQIDFESRVAPGTIATMPDATQLAAFRIVQEGLTNALKHAHGQPVSVRLGEDGRELRVEIVNPLAPDGPGGSARGSLLRGSGRGLIGLRERAAGAGGSLDAGSRDGHYVLRAALPIAPGHE